MLALSDTSICRILRCLYCKSAPDTLDSLRKSCKRINEHIRAIGMDKLENVLLNLSSSCSSHEKLFKPEKLFYPVTTELGFKKTCDDKCPDCLRVIHLRQQLRITHRRLPMDTPPPQPEPQPPTRPLRAQLEEVLGRAGLDIPVESIYEFALPDELLLRRSGSYYSQFYEGFCVKNPVVGCINGAVTRMFAKKVKTLDEVPSTEYFLERLEDALYRVRSVSTLKLSGWRIDENLLRCLLNHPKLKTVREVYFLHCVMTMSKEVFLEFLHSRPIKGINLWSRFRGFLIDDSCLMNADRISLDGTCELQKNQYPGITDNLLKQWSEQAPIKVNLSGIKTKFTINEVIGLIKCNIANNNRFYLSIQLDTVGSTDDLNEEDGPSGGPDRKKTKVTKNERKPRNTQKNKNTIQTRSRITRSTSK